MRLLDLVDRFEKRDIYIVGTGPSSNGFPFGSLNGEICIGLNDAYKMHPDIAPVALMNHRIYSLNSAHEEPIFHPNFSRIHVPVAKYSGRDRVNQFEESDELFFGYHWSHDLLTLSHLSKFTDTLHFTPEGSALQGGLQLAYLLGARRIFVIGCDGTRLGGDHYAEYDKGHIRSKDDSKTQAKRNYNSYAEGILHIQNLLKLRGIDVFGLNSVVGFHRVADQLAFKNRRKTLDSRVSDTQFFTDDPI